MKRKKKSFLDFQTSHLVPAQEKRVCLFQRYKHSEII